VLPRGGVVRRSDCAAGALKCSSIVTIGAFSNVYSVNVKEHPAKTRSFGYLTAPSSCAERPILLGQMFTTCRFILISPSSLIPDPRCSPQTSLLIQCATPFIGILSSSNSGVVIISHFGIHITTVAKFILPKPSNV